MSSYVSHAVCMSRLVFPSNEVLLKQIIIALSRQQSLPPTHTHAPPGKAPRLRIVEGNRRRYGRLRGSHLRGNALLPGAGSGGEERGQGKALRHPGRLLESRGHAVRHACRSVPGVSSAGETAVFKIPTNLHHLRFLPPRGGVEKIPLDHSATRSNFARHWCEEAFLCQKGGGGGTGSIFFRSFGSSVVEGGVMCREGMV